MIYVQLHDELRADLYSFVAVRERTSQLLVCQKLNSY